MKIGIADNCALKFCQDLKEHWEKKHEVRYEIGASEILAQWADLYYIDWWDNNAHYLFNWYKEHPEAKRPKFVVRAIDWDVWVRGIRSQEMVDFFDTFICIAPHIERWLLKEKDDATGVPIQWGNKLHLVRPGVNLEKYPLKQSQTDGFQIGMVLGDLWWPKNHMAGLDIFTTLARRDDRWRLHIRGQHEGGQYWPVMYEHFLDSRGIRDKVILYGPQENMDQWYEKIDYLLHPGMKEAFCYAVAEAMAKGITPICNQFYGSEDIWPSMILYQTHEEAVSKFENKLAPVALRKYIVDNYSIERMVRYYDELLGT